MDRRALQSQARLRTPNQGALGGAFRVACGFRRAQKLYFGSGAQAGLYFFCTYSRLPPPPDHPGDDAPAGKGPYTGLNGSH